MPRYIKIAQTSDIAPGKGRCFDVEGKPVAIFNLNGEFFAIDDVCSHLGASLADGEVRGETVTCPWHSADFSIRTGEALCPPADEAVRSYPTRVEGGDVLVELD